jgi:hypothetical protein
MSEMTVGTIVEVARGNIHCHKQGQIVGFDENDPNEPVRVWFGRENDFLLDYQIRMEISSHAGNKNATEPPQPEEQAQDLRTWNYAPEHLKTCPTGWTMETLANRYFGNMWNGTLYKLKIPFVAGARDCDVEGCQNLTTKRILVDLQGSVYDAHVCDTHASKYDRKCMDDFPWKKREATQTA